MTHQIEKSINDKLNSVMSHNWKWINDVMDYEPAFIMRDANNNEFAALLTADGEGITGLKRLVHKGLYVEITDDQTSEILELANDWYQTELNEIQA